MNYDHDYDVYSLNLTKYYSKPLVIWAEGSSSPLEEQALKSAWIAAFKLVRDKKNCL